MLIDDQEVASREGLVQHDGPRREQGAEYVSHREPGQARDTGADNDVYRQKNQ